MAGDVAVEDVATRLERDGAGVGSAVLHGESHLVLPALDDQRVFLEAVERVLDGHLAGGDLVAVSVEVLGVVADDPQHAIGGRDNGRSTATPPTGRGRQPGQGHQTDDGTTATLAVGVSHGPEATDGR